MPASEDQKRVKDQITQLSARLGSSGPEFVSIQAQITELEKLLIEYDKVALENQKTSLEVTKARYTLFGVLVSLCAVLATLYGAYTSVSSQQRTVDKQLIAQLKIANDQRAVTERQLADQLQIANTQAQEQWDIKVADLLLSSEDDGQFNDRLRTLKQLFKERMAKVSAMEHEGDDDHLANVLLRLVAAHPNDAETIARTWHAFWKHDDIAIDLLKELRAKRSLTQSRRKAP